MPPLVIDKEKWKPCLDYLKFFVKWLLIAVVVGVIVGVIGAGFAHVLAWVNALRAAYPKITLGLPVGGLVIVWLYQVTKNTGDKGTNTIIEAVRGEAKTSFLTAPLIFVSTAITHLFGGSAGREGAALQLGGSIAGAMGTVIRLSDEDRRIIVMCGMAAGFSALFGTPMAAAVFALEVACVGAVEYTALFPCVAASLVAHFVAEFLQVPPEVFHLSALPAMGLVGLLQVLALAAAAAGVSVIFCLTMHKAEQLYKQFPNPYARIAIGGILVLVMAAVWETGDYLGSGMGMIEHIFHSGEPVEVWAFLLKIVFTAATLGAGFKGGEIVPSFTIGAALGCVAGPWIGLPMELGAAIGMTAVFCGVTNCPITALLISFELFGFEGMPWYLCAVAVSYLLSAKHSLYHVQNFRHSKLSMK